MHFRKLQVLKDERYTKREFSDESWPRPRMDSFQATQRTYYRISFFNHKERGSKKKTARVRVPTGRLWLGFLYTPQLS